MCSLAVISIKSTQLLLLGEFCLNSSATRNDDDDDGGGNDDDDDRKEK